MEQEQREQRRLIESLCKQNEELLALIQNRNPPQIICNSPLNFEEAFSSFIDSYGSLEPRERPQKVRALRQLIPLPQRSMVTGLMRTLVGNECEDFINAELPDTLDSQPLSPTHANNELTNGFRNCKLTTACTEEGSGPPQDK